MNTPDNLRRQRQARRPPDMDTAPYYGTPSQLVASLKSARQALAEAPENLLNAVVQGEALELAATVRGRLGGTTALFHEARAVAQQTSADQLVADYQLYAASEDLAGEIDTLTWNAHALRYPDHTPDQDRSVRAV